MKLSTLLLSSAALVVAGSAFAADLPAKKGAPAAKAATGCPAFGAGFFSIPGGDNCIKIGGYARLDATYTANGARGSQNWTLPGEYGINVDARSSTDQGVLRSYINLEAGTGTASANRAYVQLGGLTAGAADGMLDWGGGVIGGLQYGGGGTGRLSYSANGFSVGITEAQNQNPATTLYASRPDIIATYALTAGSVSGNIGIASHEVVGSTTTSAQGYAVVGSAGFDAGVAKIGVYGAYSEGASAYLGNASTTTAVYDSSTTSSNLSKGSNTGVWATLPAGAGKLNAYLGQYSISQDTSSVKATQYELAYTFSPVKGLTVIPAIRQDITSTATTNSGYLRIQRDF